MRSSFLSLIKSFQYAIRGLILVWQREQNFRIQIFIGILVVCAMLIFDMSRFEQVVLLLLIVFVLSLEILNTVIEHLIDLLKPRLHQYVELMKDLMAALVFLGSLFALLIGLIIFYPYIFR